MKDINVLIIFVYMNKGESYEKTFLKLLAVSMLVGCITACGDDPVKSVSFIFLNGVLDVI